MPPKVFEPAISASEWPQTHALHRVATGIDLSGYLLDTKYSSGLSFKEPLCDSSKHVRHMCNPNSASDRRVRGQNLYRTRVQDVRQSHVRKPSTACTCPFHFNMLFSILSLTVCYTNFSLSVRFLILTFRSIFWMFCSSSP